MHDRLLQLGAQGPVLIISVAVACSLGALLPPPAGMALILGLLLVSLALGSQRLEPVTLWLRYRVRPLNEGEQALFAPVITRLGQARIAPPVVHILFAPRGAQVPQPIGHHTVRISTGMLDQLTTGLLSVDEAAAAMAYAVGIRDASHLRFQMVYEFWTLPWQVIQTVTGGIGRMFTKLPLVGPAWGIRGLLGATALSQCAQQGQWVIGLLAFMLVALTYLTPWCHDQWDLRLQRAASQFVIDHGLDEARLQMMRREPGTPAVREHSRHATGTGAGTEPAAPSPTMLVVNESLSIGQDPHDDGSPPAFCSHTPDHSLADPAPGKR